MMKFFRKPEVKGFHVGLVIIILGFLISYFRYQGLHQVEKNDLIKVLATVEQNISRTIHESHNAALTLALTVGADGKVKDFESVAARILENNESIDLLELLPDGVIEYVYPLKGNEVVQGYDVLNDPKVQLELERASLEEKMYFAGPFELKQGGLAVAGRLPIFLNGELWGYSAVLIYLETLISQSGINTYYQDEYYFQLTKTNPNTGEEESFLPLREDITLNSYDTVSFPDGDWKLYGAKIGKSEAKIAFILIMTLSLIIGIISGYASVLFFRKPEELKELLEEKSRELIASREMYKNKSGLLQSILESPKDMEIFSLDRNFCYLAFTTSHEKSVKKFFNKEIAVGDCILDGLSDQELTEKVKNIYAKVLTGEHVEFTYKEDEGPFQGNYYENKLAPIIDDNHEIIGLTSFIIDITAREKAEMESEKHEQRFKALIENGSDGVAILNVDATASYIGPSVEKILGYTEEEALSLGLAGLVHEEDLHKATKVIEQALLQPGVTIRGYTSRMKHKDGSWRWIEAVVTNLLDDPAVRGIVDNFRDVTEKVEAENELKRVLEQLRSHLENSPLGVIEYTKDLYVTKWSKKCEEIFGWSEEEMIGKHAFDFIYEPSKKEVVEVGSELSKGDVNGNISYNSNYTKSGKIVDCIWYNSIIKNEDGEVLNIMSLVEDITLKNQAEEQLRESEHRFRTLVNNSPYCIHEIGLDGMLTSINKAGLGIVGLSEEHEIVGLPYLQNIGEKDLPRIADLQERAFKGEHSEFEYDSIYGKRFLSSFVPIKDKEGNVQRLMGMTQDVTERKKNEETIANSLKEKTTLLSEIHHRVKNNLAIVSGLLQLQSNETNDERLTLAFDQSINRIISIAMVHELLYKSQDLSSINIHSYLDSLLPAITRTLKDDRKEIDVDIDIEDYKMNINEAIPLGLLLNELFTNSFKYAFEDGKKGKITVRLKVEDNCVIVSYEDNGKGFGEENDFEEPRNLGLTLIHTQMSQLSAKYEVDTNSKFKLEFKFSAKEKGSHSNISN